MNGSHISCTWMAADYHFPAAYSCRVPVTSVGSAQAMPAPAPATVRLTLIRVGIELFGVDYTRDELFPAIRAAEIRIRPPERVAISVQLLRAIKATETGKEHGVSLTESIVYREFAHAQGMMTLYLKIPETHERDWRDMLGSVGYWGRADSLASCTRIYSCEPRGAEFPVPLRELSSSLPIRRFFSSVATEFADREVAWDEVMPVSHVQSTEPLKKEIYVWPMIIGKRCSSGKLLLRRSLA